MTTVTKPNRVFFISREFNFIRDEFTWYKNGTSVKLADYINSIVKALSSGFGPYPIVSIKIKDKKAVVDIGQECYLQPGVKISLDGSTVALIDTWHEIQEVSGNTYTVYIDAPDGDYTNGVTMGYPSLGWSLLDRDANNLLFKSGTSASMAHYVQFTLNPGKPINVESWRNILTVQRVKCEGTLNSVYEIQPNPTFAETGIFCYVDNPQNYPYSWFYYGDDAFVHMAFKGQTTDLGGTRYLYQACMNLLTFGEISKGPFRSGYFIINGPWGGNTAGTSIRSAYTANNYQVHLCYYSGLSYGKTNTLVLTNTNDKNSYAAYADVYQNLDTRVMGKSGGQTDSQRVTVKYYLENMYSSPTLYLTNEDICIGQVPGIYYLYRQPNMTMPYSVASSLIPIKAIGKLKDRHTYAIAGGDYSDADFQLRNDLSIHSFNWSHLSTYMLDLTGPIR